MCLLIWEAVRLPPRLVHIQQRRMKQTFGDWKAKNGEDWPGTARHNGMEKHGEHGHYQLQEDEDFDTIDPRLEDVIWRGLEVRSVVNRELEERSGAFKDLQKANVYRIRSNCPPPSIYRVRRDSHQLLLMTYIRTFSCLDSVAKTYFNFNLDTLYIQPHVFPCFSGQHDTKPIAKLAEHLRIINPEDLRRMKKLAIFLEAELVMDSLHESLHAILPVFSGVEVSLVVKRFRDGAESRQDAHLTEPIQVWSAISSYHRHINILSRGHNLELRLFPIHTVAQVDNRIEWVKATWRHYRRDPSVKGLPYINVKSLVSASLKTVLDRARRMYNMALRNYEIKMEALREAQMRETWLRQGAALKTSLWTRR